MTGRKTTEDDIREARVVESVQCGPRNADEGSKTADTEYGLSKDEGQCNARFFER